MIDTRGRSICCRAIIVKEENIEDSYFFFIVWLYLHSEISDCFRLMSLRLYLFSPCWWSSLKHQYLTSNFYCVCGCAACTAHAGTLLIFSIRVNVEHILPPFAVNTGVCVALCRILPPLPSERSSFCPHFAVSCFCTVKMHHGYHVFSTEWKKTAKKNIPHNEGRLATNSWIEWKKKRSSKGGAWRTSGKNKQ